MCTFTPAREVRMSSPTPTFRGGVTKNYILPFHTSRLIEKKAIFVPTLPRFTVLF